MPKYKMLICDLDNTIYDWYAAFLPAFYEMSAISAEILGCDKDKLLAELQDVHIKHKDVEHPFSILETDTVQKLAALEGEERVARLLDPAFHAFNRYRKANLKLYPDTIKTLDEIKEHKIRLIAYTDSKYYAATGRVRRLNIESYFEKIYCREKGETRIPKEYMHENLFDDDIKIRELPSNEMKPNPKVLFDISKDTNERIDDIAYIGDSISKDILMAKKAGCFAVWAKYGTHTDTEMYEKLVKISHWTTEDIERERNYRNEAKNIEPDFICQKSIAEVLEAII